jgi:hypothetical protein
MKQITRIASLYHSRAFFIIPAKAGIHAARQKPASTIAFDAFP